MRTTIVKPVNSRHLALGLCLLAASTGSIASDDPVDEQSISLFERYAVNAQELAVRALSFVGVGYRRGGESPETGFDCSGLVRHVFRETLGLILPRTSLDISRVGTTVQRHSLQPGDLVFFNTLRRGYSHVGIYLGEHRFVHAPATGGEVRVEDMRQNYWIKRFNGARRIAQADIASSAN
ncbi:MAG: C40 family peptidase [Sulfuritalea sp.]|nr:C40 family peptidase [Sulfuritalea sp.]